MSLRVMTQGGGAGGESASIFVTGLSESDTVSATKDGKTVQGKWESNTIYKIQPLIPVMTSNTTPSGVASQKNSYSTYQAYMAFRNKIPESGADTTVSSYGTSLPWYIDYMFQEECEISYFEAYFAHPDSGYGTSSTGYISVSDDGTAWTQVKSFSNLAQGTVHTIQLDTPVSCKYLRFSFTAYNNNYNNKTVRVCMIQAYGLVPVVFGGHSITPIKSYGTWTVTATNGEDTATQDVLVDAAAEFEIKMSFAGNYLMLYDCGDECKDLTGGWESTYAISKWGSNTNTLSRVSATKNADSIKLSTSARYTYCPINTVNKVSLDGYSAAGAVILNDGNVYHMGCLTLGTSLSGNTVNQTLTTDKLKVWLNEFTDGTTSGTHLIHGDITDSFESCYCTFFAVKGETSDPNSTIYVKAYFLLGEDDWLTLCSKAGLYAPSTLAELIADGTSISAILASETAVQYMVNNCTGDFMASFVANVDCLSALSASSYKHLVFANKHWAKFLAMVGVTA